MKKIPSLFVRDWNGDRRRVTREVTPECQWVIDGEGTPTRKRDGTACMVRDGRLFKRYDAKRGRTPPPGFEPCQPEPDPVTGHHPGWLEIAPGKPEDKHFAPLLAEAATLPDGTYELCGPKFQANPERLAAHTLIPHGTEMLTDCDGRDYDSIAFYLQRTPTEGIVWHHPDGRMCKIKRTDFGIQWPPEGDQP